MSIIIGADLVPTEENISLFCQGDTEELFGHALLEMLRQADYRIFNLEVPLVDDPSPISKVGAAMLAPKNTVRAMKQIPVDLFTLANNHSLDQGPAGLYSTCETLEKAGIAAVGAGITVEEAAKPYVFLQKGKRIGVYACAEHEFSIVDGQRCGANPIDLLETPDHIAHMKQNCDYVIVLYHGGKEYYRYPSPMLQKVCRKLVEKGADLVVCQHSHCVGSYEKYHGGCIVYGQGNFLFEDGDGVFVQTGVLVRIGDDFQIDFIPLRRIPGRVRLAEGKDAQKILGELEQRSVLLQQPEQLQKLYQTFADEQRVNYLKALNGARQRSFLYRVLNKLTAKKWEQWDLKRQYQQLDRLRLRNYIECEAHRELLLTGLCHRTEH